MRHFLQMMLVSAMAGYFAGCASTHEPSGFLSHSRYLSEGEYFKQTYVKPEANFSVYDTVIVEPVDLNYFNQEEDQDPSEIQDLAIELHQDLESKLSESYLVLSPDSPKNPGTLVIQPALVQVGTPERTLNVITSLLIWIPVTSGSAAFEAKIIDGATGELLAEVAEKQTAGTATDAESMLVGSYTKYSHSRAAFKKWAQNFQDMLQNKKGNV